MPRGGSEEITATELGLAIPIPAVVVEGGTVVAANAAALGLGPAATTGIPLADWFDEGSTDVVAAAFGPTDEVDHPIARIKGRETWVALHTSGEKRDGPELVLLRPATHEQFTRSALDTVADSTFVLDAEGRSRWRTARLRRRSGTPDEVAAQLSAGERIHPEDLPLVFDAFITATRARPNTIIARSRAVDDDDRWEWIELVIWHRLDDHVLGGYLVQVHNLDEGRRLEIPLDRADPELLSLTEAAPVGIAVTDPAGTIVYRNRAAQAIFGPGVESLGGADWLDLAREEHRPNLAAAFEAAVHEGRESTVTAAFRDHADRGDDAVRWLRLRLTPQRSSNDRGTGVIATIEDVTEQVEARAETERLTQRLHHLATHDPLTSLPNRAALAEELERAASRHRRSGTALAVLFCDLDGFKPINDEFGHAGGDGVLVQIGQRLRAAVRDAEFVARLGGDEFVVVCEDAGEGEHAVQELAARLHERLAEPVRVNGRPARVGLTVGIAISPAGDTTAADSLLLLADEAMYIAKAAGPGGTCVRWASGAPAADAG